MPDRIRIQPSADADIDDHFSYLLSESPGAAFRFLGAIEETFELLLSQPQIGYRRNCKNPQLGGIRSFPVKGFGKWLVFYRSSGLGIEVLRILHGAQDIERILDRDR